MQRLTDAQLADVAECIVDRQPKCNACDGSGVVHAGFCLDRKTCSTCDGTGFFALSAEAMRSIVDELRLSRAENERLRKERDEAVKQREGIRRCLQRELHENVPQYAAEMERLTAERDGLLARCERAEAERDEALHTVKFGDEDRRKLRRVQQAEYDRDAARAERDAPRTAVAKYLRGLGYVKAAEIVEGAAWKEGQG